MAERNKEKWDGRVRLIGISVDKTVEPVVSHINDGSRKWTDVEHYLKDESDAPSVYGVKGVPKIVLVDRAGRIVFMGHPNERKNLEQDLNSLAEGKSIRLAAAETIEYSSISPAEMNTEIDLFRD